MEIKTINHNSKKLILLFAGWGMDERSFSHLSGGEEYDIITIYNYTDFKLKFCKILNCNQTALHHNCPIYRTFSNYSEIYIVAYGTGVWAASLTFSKFLKHLESKGKFRIMRLLKKIKKAVAINGTLCPVSNIWGIKQEIFNNSLEALKEELSNRSATSSNNSSICSSPFMQKFIGRVFNHNREQIERYLSNPQQRGLEDIYNELEAIKEQFIFNNAIFWNKVIISKRDLIIPTKNQLRFWSEYEMCLDKENRLTFNANDFTIQHTDAPHFPFYNWTSWSEII